MFIHSTISLPGNWNMQPMEDFFMMELKRRSLALKKNQVIIQLFCKWNN
jgi:hypothetical protein